MAYYQLRVEFLNNSFHGNPEWPPSPLRLFQALVATSARSNGGEISDNDYQYLSWLAAQEPPDILCPQCFNGQEYVTYVPNNEMDIIAKGWSNNKDIDISKHKTGKTIHSKHLRKTSEIYYIWGSQELNPALERISELAQQLVVIGTGIDYVVCDGCIVKEIPQMYEHWKINKRGYNVLRIPSKNTLKTLITKHSEIMQQVQPNGFNTPQVTVEYQSMPYYKTTDPIPLSFTAFSLISPNIYKMSYFNTPKKALTVSGMARNALKQKILQIGGDPAWVLGHGEKINQKHIPVKTGVSILPIPNITKGKVSGIQHIIICASDETRYLFHGSLLSNEKTKNTEAIMSITPSNNISLRPYVKHGHTWSTVIPMILPGYDNIKNYKKRLRSNPPDKNVLITKLRQKTDKLMRKALSNIGYSDEIVDNAIIQWNQKGFLSGVDHAYNYGAPKHIKSYPRYHVKISFFNRDKQPIKLQGPICIGAGSRRGYGLLAICE